MIASPYSLRVIAIATLLSSVTHAAPFAWTGTTDGRWNTGTNWDAGVPGSAVDTTLIFNNGVQLTTDHNIPGGLSVNSLTIGASSGTRVFNGSQTLTFAGSNPSINVATTSVDQEFNLPIHQDNGLTITSVRDFAAQLLLGSPISGTGSLNFADGIVNLYGASNYTGATSIQGNTLLAAYTNTAFGNSSGITVAPDAELRVSRFNPTSITNINRPLNLAGLLSSNSKRSSTVLGPFTSSVYSGAITLTDNAMITVFGATGTGLNSVDLQIDGGVDRNGNTLSVLTQGSDNSVTFASAVSGSGKLDLQLDGGEVTLADISGDADFSAGGTGGTVTVSSLSGNGLLSLGFTDFGGSVSVSGVVSGNRNLAVSRGTLVLSSESNTFAGAIDLSNLGTISVATEASLGNAANTITFTDGGVIKLTSAGSLTRAIQTTGAGSVDINGISRTISSPVTGTGAFGLINFSLQAIVTLSGPKTFEGGLQISGNTIVSFSNDDQLGIAGGGIQLGGGSLIMPAGLGTLNRPIEVTIGNGSLGGAHGDTYALPQNITGAGVLTLGGAASYIPTGVNSHGGFALVGESSGSGSPAVLAIGGDAQLGAPTGVLNIGRQSGFFVSPGALRATGNLDVAASRSTTFRKMTVDTNGFDVTFNQPISGRDITKTGEGVLRLNTANTDSTGDNIVSIEQGTLRIGVNDALGTRATVNMPVPAAILDLNDFNLTLNELSVEAGSEVSLGAGTLTVRTGSVLGPITGDGGVVIAGFPGSGSMVRFGGANAFSGGLAVQNGSLLEVLDPSAFGAPGNPVLLDDGGIATSFFGSAPVVIDATSNLTVGPGGARFSASSQSLVIASQLTGSAPLNFIGGSAISEDPKYEVRLANAANTFIGDIQLGDSGSSGFGSATLGILADGSLGNTGNIVTLGDHFFDSETHRVSQGRLRAFANLTLPATRAIRLNGSLDGSDDMGGVIDTNGFNVTIESAISQLSPGIPLVKAGSGTLFLNGTNTYTGDTTVLEGTLGGGGTVARLQVESGATLSPGASPGVFTTGDLQFSSNANLALDFASATLADKLVVNGSLDIAADAQLMLTLAYSLTGPDTFVVVDNDGVDPVNGTFYLGGNELSEGETFTTPGVSWTISYLGGTGNDVTLTATVSANPYASWIDGFFPGSTDPQQIGINADPDHDGESNIIEFTLGGDPANGGDRAKVYSLIQDSSIDPDTDPELLITILVRDGTPAFTGSPSPSSIHEGFTYAVEGSTGLVDFSEPVSPVNPVTPNLPPPPSGYVYRSFSLNGSNSTPSAGFLRVRISQ